MKRTPFYPIRNSKLTFEVEDSSSDTKDSAGNPIPSKRKIVVEAFLKPIKRSTYLNYENYANLGTSEEFLEGYLVNPSNGYPDGINNLSKTVSALYRDQKGEFTVMISLQNSVKADLITGHPIKGLFKVIGGQ